MELQEYDGTLVRIIIFPLIFACFSSGTLRAAYLWVFFVNFAGAVEKVPVLFVDFELVYHIFFFFLHVVPRGT